MTVLCRATKEISCLSLSREYGPGALMKITLRCEKYGGNSHPHFSATADITTTESRKRRDSVCGGCLHDEIRKHWKVAGPIVDLHLADHPSGEPMHAEANGWYWLRGHRPDDLGKDMRYHGGTGEACSRKTPAECLAIFARHVRLPLGEAEDVANKIATRVDWAKICQDMGKRWAGEARDGVRLIESLGIEGTS